jgi:transposase
MALRDELGVVYTDEQFRDLFPERGQPAESPARLALVIVLQYVKGLTDRQAADAVRGRIDWKYALGLELTDPGFDYSILSEFRARLIAGAAEERLLTTLLTVLKERGRLKAGGRQRTDSTHVLAAIRQLNRYELVGECLRNALNQLAQTAPEWLLGVVSVGWHERYGRRFDSFHLPDSREIRQALAQQIGADGYWLMAHAFALDAPASVRSMSCIEILRQIWVQPAEKRIRSPDDVDARYARHNDIEWVGYRTHLTETCDIDAPIHLITQVETVLAPVQDVEVSEIMHADLAQKDLKPKEHFVDAAYVSANLLAKATHEEGIELIGPVTKLQDVSWQTREQTGYDLSRFNINWEAKVVTCPQDRSSVKWVENCKDSTGNAVIHVTFAAVTCSTCSARSACTRSQHGGRTMPLRPQEQHEALQQVRAEQTTSAFKRRYRSQLGIEGTISQAVRAFELRETRYLGLAKTHLQAVAEATAIDLCRFWDYLRGTGLGQVKTSPFAALTA